MTTRTLLILSVSLLFFVACGKTDGGEKPPATDNTAETEPATDTPAEETPEVAEETPEAPEEEPLPTPEDFEEEAATEITTDSLEKELSNLEKELEDVE